MYSMRCADAMSAEPSLITVLVGAAIENDLLGLAADLAAATSPQLADPAFLRRLAAELPQADWQAQARRALELDAATLIHELSVPPDVAQRILFFPWQELTQACVVEHTVRSLDATNTPVGGRPDPPEIKPSVFMVHQRLAWMVGSPRVVRRAQDVMAQRQLVSTALRLRALALGGSGYPESLPASMSEPNPFTGRPLEYAPRGDGSVELRITGVFLEYPGDLGPGRPRRTVALPAGPRL